MTPWWRRGGPLAMFAGVVAAGALPPLSWLPLLPLSLSLAYALWDKASVARHPGRYRFWIGWAFGWGYFSVGLYWVAYAFLVDATTFAWMIPFALAGLGAGLGLFAGAAFWLAGFSQPHPLVRWVGFSAAWVLVEVLRGWVLTGFPWNALGTVWAPFPVFSQGAALFGMYGLSGLVVLAATAPMAGWRCAFGGKSGGVRG
ncbi:MAG: apolipoprotein N-acyltransferase, partial [Rhodospirillaceae bacterium]|nr:apolipoprotein N-acyltransferase [Rhodospirillaceae bacterium]